METLSRFGEIVNFTLEKEGNPGAGKQGEGGSKQAEKQGEITRAGNAAAEHPGVIESNIPRLRTGR